MIDFFGVRTFKNEDWIWGVQGMLLLRLWAHIVSRGLARSMWSAMHSQVCGEAQRDTGTGFINKPNKGRCCQWPLRCGFGSGGKADVYPEETNKALSCQLGGESAQNSIIRGKQRSDHVSEGRWPPRCTTHPAETTKQPHNTICFWIQQLCSTCTEGWTVNCHGDNLQM